MPEIIAKEFKDTIVKIKTEIKTTQMKTMHHVNSELIMMYFRVGKILAENSKYGEKFIKSIAAEIKLEFPDLRGFGERNLKYMQLFYREYANDTKVQQLVAQLPWGQNILLMTSIKDKSARIIYMEAALTNGWSRSVLAMQIEAGYHKRIGKTTNNFTAVLPPDGSDMASSVLKDPYIFDFLALREDYKEKDLEQAMINKIRDVLLELGSGFAYVGNQYKITVGDEDYYIDLLFYHLKLKCYVVVELKATKYIPEFAGKMNFYLSAIDDTLKDPSDNPSIGLILCKEKDKFTAQYSLKDINKPIGVSSYELKKYLPDTGELNLLLDI